MQARSIGIRELRAKLAEYLLDADQPIAVTRHGATVGYFIPVKATQAEANHAALKQAAAHVDAMLKRAGFTDRDTDEVARGFRAWRKKRKK
jgi:prevent-host-death family protein